MSHKIFDYMLFMKTFINPAPYYIIMLLSDKGPTLEQKFKFQKKITFNRIELIGNQVEWKFNKKLSKKLITLQNKLKGVKTSISITPFCKTFLNEIRLAHPLWKACNSIFQLLLPNDIKKLMNERQTEFQRLMDMRTFKGFRVFDKNHNPIYEEYFPKLIKIPPYGGSIKTASTIISKADE